MTQLWLTGSAGKDIISGIETQVLEGVARVQRFYVYVTILDVLEIHRWDAVIDAIFGSLMMILNYISLDTLIAIIWFSVRT